ncbi:MAG TPA: isochorismatase family cysteine hydrolase [Gemmatimonadaceae bacterium]|nr:isochorismatase family cysteine hydrolase [Gemmatimonadaceae bacterium]
MKRAYGLDIPSSLEDACAPNRTAVLVYDMQVGIVPQIPTGHEIAAQVARVLAAARAGGYRVYFTRHMTLPNAVAGVSQLRTAMAWQRVDDPTRIVPRFLRDAPAWQIVPDLAPTSDEAVFDKLTMSAFEGTPLDFALRDCGINSFVIVGIALEIGIEPTVRHATDLGYLPIVPRDACGYRDQAAADRAMAGFAFAGDSIVTDVETVTQIMARGRRSRHS